MSRRLFLALDLPEACRNDLMDLQEGLGIGREVPEENLHLTLAFLGDQPEALLQPLHEGLSTLNAMQVRLQLRGLEVFGGKHPAALVVLGERVPELMQLQQKVAWVVRQAGIDLPRRRFKPHVTVARFARGMPAEARQRLQQVLASRGDCQLPLVEAERFALYQSTLLAEGPRYEALAHYPLRPA